MRRTRFMTVLAIISAALCVGVVAFHGGRRSASDEADAAAPRVAVPLRGPDGLPRNADPSIPAGSPLACDRPHVDVGETTSRQQVHEFELENVSHETIRITGTHKSCPACVKAEFTNYELAPGATTIAKLDFPIRTRDGMPGDFVERLEVYVGDGNEFPAAVLSVAGRYIPPAYVVGRGIHIEVPSSKAPAFKGAIEVRVNTAHGFRIASTESVGPLPFDVSIRPDAPLPGEEEERFTIEVSGSLPSDMELPATGTVIAKVNSKDVPELRIPVVVFEPERPRPRVTPERLAFGVLEAGASATRTVVVVFPDDGDYTVDTAATAARGVRTEVKAAGGTKRASVVRCELDAKELSGAVKAELVLTVASAGTATETYKVPISAYIKPPATGQTGTLAGEPPSN